MLESNKSNEENPLTYLQDSLNLFFDDIVFQEDERAILEEKFAQINKLLQGEKEKHMKKADSNNIYNMNTTNHPLNAGNNTKDEFMHNETIHNEYEFSELDRESPSYADSHFNNENSSYRDIGFSN